MNIHIHEDNKCTDTLLCIAHNWVKNFTFVVGVASHQSQPITAHTYISFFWVGNYIFLKLQSCLRVKHRKITLKTPRHLTLYNNILTD